MVKLNDYTKNISEPVFSPGELNLNSQKRSYSSKKYVNHEKQQP